LKKKKADKKNNLNWKKQNDSTNLI